MTGNSYQGPMKEIVVTQLSVIPHSSVPKMLPWYWPTKVYVCCVNPVAKKRKRNKYIKENKE